ncbi:hypothetical protein JGH11_08580 [Dysgonomonas sp. Marseille-P4677]|uniref:hypothetical protein n=1 Tax=Dysgonomonas sp. Marseille-P4677 TaxID=2364790 RepID=UPI0019136D8E|nr:hypothetical protein [Dysgonomonas sp. Marseille-P4677]MBK5720924.1 hypothetical protein [Dysgonomonas sp. Marseille-P4677]
MEYQKKLIDIISRYVPEDEKLVDFISGLIHLGKEASYRRIRCEVEFTLSEVVTIAKKLNINLTSLIIREGGEKVTCNLRLIDETSAVHGYIKKIEADLNILEGFEKKSGSTFYTVNRSIPELFYFPYTYLTKLKLFKIQFNKGTVQPLPLAQIDIPDVLSKVRQEYWDEIKLFKLIFILDPNLLTSVVNDISFFYNLNLITEEEKNQLKRELISVLDTINESASTGLYRGKKVSFYVSHVTLALSHSLIVSKGLEASIINLHYPNSLLSFDQEMTQAQMKRLQIIKKCSSLISQSGELNKIAFLNRQREKLYHL